MKYNSATQTWDASDSYLATAPNMTNNPSVTKDITGATQVVNSNNTSPAVVSNYNTQKKVNDINTQFQNHAATSVPQFQQTGSTPVPTTQDMTSYGEPFTAPQGAEKQADGNYLYQGNYYTKDQLGSPESLAAISNTTNQQKKYDTALQSQLEAINKQFDVYKQQQQDITQSGAAGATNAMLQTGQGGRGNVAQYASASSDARVQSIMSDGQKALAQLDSQRLQLLSAAQQAYQDKNSQLLDKLNSQISKNRDDMLSVSRKSNEALALETKNAKKSADIASAFEAVGNNPVDIIKNLKEKGVTNVTAKDINDTLSLISNEEGIDKIRLKLVEAGKDPSILNGVKNVTDALNKVGTTLAKPNEEVIKVGNLAYIYDKNTGKITQTLGGGITRSTSGGVSTGGSVTSASTVPNISKSAQNIVDLINKGSGTMDDYIKGTSNAAQALRNEVIYGISATGGKTAKDINNLLTTKDIIDEMITKKDYNQLGYSAKLGGQFTTEFGDFKTRAQQLNALLAKDNLGLLKGAMSDKDLAFIEAMSGGVGSENTISEAYAKQRMEAIQKGITEKLKGITPVSDTVTKGNLNDRDFVQKALTAKNIKYDDFVNGTQQGEIPALDNATGEPVYILINEYDPAKYTKI